MNKLLLAGSLVSLFATFACSAGSNALLDTCSGAYSCTDGSQTVSTQLEKSGGACTAGQLTLNADGTVSGVDNTTWDGNSQQFEVCSDGACLTCTSASSSASGGEGDSGSGSTGKCTGAPMSCSSLVPPGCGEVNGCYMTFSINWDGSDDDYCTGSADSCDTMSDKSSCQSQGCAWKQ